MKILRTAFIFCLLLLAFLAGFILSALTLGGYSPNMLLELASNETPGARVSDYLRVIQTQDRAGALEAWTLPAPNAKSFTSLNERRSQITDELLGRSITGFTILDTQWWGTCCEPGVTTLARNAGGARLHVQLMDAQGRPWQYIFDVFTNGSYFGDAIGNPYRHWLLRDVYPSDEPPLFWTLVYSGEVHAP